MQEALELGFAAFWIFAEEVVDAVLRVFSQFGDRGVSEFGIHRIHFFPCVVEERQHAAEIGFGLVMEANKQVPMLKNANIRLLKPHRHPNPVKIERLYSVELRSPQENNASSHAKTVLDTHSQLMSPYPLQMRNPTQELSLISR